MALVLHHSRAKGTDKLVLLGIANHAGDGGAWPAVETLARYANVDERTVRRTLAKLVQLGELAVHTQAGGTHTTRPGYRPNRYDVLIACPATCDRTANHRTKPLPTSPADLWITGLTPTSPLVSGGTPASGGGGTPASAEPSIEPSTNQASAFVTGTRESDAGMHGALTPPQLSPDELHEAAERVREQLRVGATKRRAARARRASAS